MRTASGSRTPHGAPEADLCVGGLFDTPPVDKDVALAGVTGAISDIEAAALLARPIHPTLRRLLEARADGPGDVATGQPE